MLAVANTLTPVQIHILEMFNFCRNEQSMNELKSVLADYYAKRVQTEADKLWDEGILNAEAIETIFSTHLRTPYKAV